MSPILIVPELVKDSSKLKIPDQMYQIAMLCDGKHTTEQIIEKLNINRLQLYIFLKILQKKEIIKLKRVLET